MSFLFAQTWPWWAAGIGLGLTALGLAWFTGRKLGVTGGFEDACSLATKDPSSSASPDRWKLWFILGLPLGGLLANLGHWGWTFLYGRLDGLLFGSLLLKALWLAAAGFLIGFGARWAGGCPSGNTIMGVALGSKMSILATLGFLAAGMIITNFLFKVF
jgi:uncharacterized membrane protein YedE/YeeE